MLYVYAYVAAEASGGSEAVEVALAGLPASMPKSQKKPIIECHVTPLEKSQIDAIAKAAGQTRSQWLHSLIQTALGSAEDEIAARLAALEAKAERVSQLEQQLTGLAQQVQELIAAQQPSRPPHPPSPPTVAPVAGIGSQPAEPAAAPPQPYTYEDFEDEPDEILYSFLEPDNP